MKLSSIFNSKKFKDSFIYIALNTANNSVPFFILPVLIFFLTPKDLGLIGVFNMTFDFFKNVIGLGVLVQIQKKNIILKEKEFSKELSIGYLIAFFVFLILFIFFTIIPNNFFLKYEVEKELFLFALCSSIFWYYSTQTYLIVQQNKQSFLFAFLIISGTLVNFSTSYLFIKFDFGYYGRIFGILSAQIFSFFLIVLLNKTKTSLKNFLNVSFFDLFKKIKYGFGFLPFLVGNWCNKNFQKLVILSFVNLETFGIYSVGLSISRIVSITVSSVSQGLRPYINDDLYLKKFRRVKNTGIIIFVTGLSFLLICISLFDVILDLFDKESKFTNFYDLYIILMVIAFLESMNLYFKNIFIFFEKKSILNFQVVSYIMLLLIYFLFGNQDLFTLIYFILIYFVVVNLLFTLLIKLKMHLWN